MDTFTNDDQLWDDFRHLKKVYTGLQWKQGINRETNFYYERIRQNKGFQDVIKKYNK